MSSDWENIPSVILLEILGYLTRRDRLLCAEVCKQWCSVVWNPLLWTHLQIFLDKDLTDPITNSSIKIFATHIKTLDLAWSVPYLPQRWVRNRMANIAHDTSKLLALLREREVSLIHLKLTDWYFAWKFKKVIYHLTSFLKLQQRLRYLDLSNCSLNKVEVLKVLSSCRMSCETITYLNLHSAFQDVHYLITNNGLIRAVQQFVNLSTLKIDYSLFSERMLLVYSNDENKCLRYIEVYIRDCDRRSHVISSETWTRVVQNCQHLEVAIHFYNICHYDDIYYFLIDAIPLKVFSLSCGMAWDQKRSRNYTDTLNLLRNVYPKTLEKVSLHLRYNCEALEFALYNLILNCKQLKILEFDGILHDLNFIEELCQLQCQSLDVFSFRYFQVYPKTPSIYKNNIISQIWCRQVKQMENNDIRFFIENYTNPTVRIYT